MTVCESCLKFDLPDNGSRHHESVHPNDQTAIDLEVNMRDGWFWVEVKNWEDPRIPPQYRQLQRTQFIKKMLDEGFWMSLARKAQGTHDFLIPRGERPPAPKFIFLFQCNQPMPPSVNMAILQSKIASFPDLSDVSSAVLDRHLFGAIYHELNVTDCRLDQDSACMTATVPFCTWAKSVRQ